MGLEEQREEREVLDSIFPDEITGLSLQMRRRVTAPLDSSLQRLTSEITSKRYL